MATRAGMVGINGGKLRWGLGQNCEKLSARCSSGSLAEASLHVTTPLGESANDEFLQNAGADPLCGTDCEIPKDKTNAAIRSRKIEIREAG